MNVLVTGADIRNKGDELMLYAIRQKLSEMYPSVRIVRERWNSTYEYKTSMGFYELLPPPKGIKSRITYEILRRHQKPLGLVEEKDLDIVIDAAGFAYTDEWNSPEVVERILLEAEVHARRKSHGAKVIMLPQSFGPFRNPTTIRAMKLMVDNSDLVYARDKSSYDFLVDAVGEQAHIRQAPDFTNLMEGEIPEFLSVPEEYGVIVPNHWLVKKVAAEDQKNYYKYLAAGIQEMKTYGLQPLVLLHAPFQDADLVDPLEEELGENLRVIDDGSPLHLKGVLGHAQIVIGSRFHSLVGSLSQAVPSIGLGWSHKFNRLFEFYDCPDFLVRASSSVDKLRELMALLLQEPTRSDHIRKLEEGVKRHKQEVLAMWTEVEKELGVSTSYTS